MYEKLTCHNYRLWIWSPSIYRKRKFVASKIREITLALFSTDFERKEKMPIFSTIFFDENSEETNPIRKSQVNLFLAGFSHLQSLCSWLVGSQWVLFYAWTDGASAHPNCVFAQGKLHVILLLTGRKWENCFCTTFFSFSPPLASQFSAVII